MTSKTTKLLTRELFSEQVFIRDKHSCVLCHKPAIDAHHLIERKLWDDGGYYLDNGVSLCSEHHIMAETTEVSVEELRLAANITNIVVPDHMYADERYDKWGNPIMPNDRRSRGPMFYDEQVQKVLSTAKMLSLFDVYVKAGRTFHLPWSPGVQSDDKVSKNLDAFKDKEIVVTIKKDGENTSMYNDYFHARSIDGRNHPSRSWAKAFHASIQYDIPEGWRLNGENVYAKHSIAYDDLSTYFYGFGLWNEMNQRLDWDDMLQWFELLGVTPVETLYRGIWDEKKLREIADNLDTEKNEGYVVTTVEGFPYSQYRNRVAKFVRKGHVQTDSIHWQTAKVIPNKLKDK